MDKNVIANLVIIAAVITYLVVKLVQDAPAWSFVGYYILGLGFGH